MIPCSLLENILGEHMKESDYGCLCVVLRKTDFLIPLLFGQLIKISMRL